MCGEAEGREQRADCPAMRSRVHREPSCCLLTSIGTFSWRSHFPQAGLANGWGWQRFRGRTIPGFDTPGSNFGSLPNFPLNVSQRCVHPTLLPFCPLSCTQSQIWMVVDSSPSLPALALSWFLSQLATHRAQLANTHTDWGEPAPLFTEQLLLEFHNELTAQQSYLRRLTSLLSPRN